ncbi:MAG: recombinase family protein, partial [Butyricicoccus sp.]|nr:recombinase family protein [Butyricicoccus sp.]
MDPYVRIISPRELKSETLRVAAYCRVSSDSADQKRSDATQIHAYTEEIGKHNGWEMVDVYADEELSGIGMKKRREFNRMIAACKLGRVDMIL